MMKTIHDSRNEQAEFDRAMGLFDDEKYSEAIDICLNLLNSKDCNIAEYELRMLLGMAYSCAEQYNDAITQLEIALQEIQDNEEDDHLTLIMLYYLASSYFAVEKFDISINLYEKASHYLHHYEDSGQIVDLCRFLIGKGRCYLYLGIPDKALHEFIKAEKYVKMIPFADYKDKYINMTKFEIGRAYVYLRKLKLAYKYMTNIDTSAMDSGDIAHYNFTIFKLYALHGNYKAAVQMHDKVKDFGSACDQSEIAYLMGISHFHLKNFNEARRFLLKVQDSKEAYDYVKAGVSGFLRKLERKSQ